MRPGQTAPECSSDLLYCRLVRSGFNEAGADCPGMPQLSQKAMIVILGFNEAGADCPGMPDLPLKITRYTSSLQ